MADEELMNEGDAIEQKLEALQKRSKMLTLLLLVSLAVAVGSGAFAFITSRSVGAEVQAVRQATEKTGDEGEVAIEEMADAAREVGVIHPLGSFVVNLLDPGNLRYINCRIELEVEDSDTVRAVTAREAQFKDTVISLLGNQSYEDVLGVEGKARLREELLIRFNRLLPEGQIARVYLTEFVVQ
jgi:flagellar FliL protein